MGVKFRAYDKNPQFSRGLLTRECGNQSIFEFTKHRKWAGCAHFEMDRRNLGVKDMEIHDCMILAWNSVYHQRVERSSVEVRAPSRQATPFLGDYDCLLECKVLDRSHGNRISCPCVSLEEAAVSLGTV